MYKVCRLLSSSNWLNQPKSCIKRVIFKKYTSIIPGREFTQHHLHTHWPRFPVLKKMTWLFSCLSPTERRAHAVSTVLKQHLVSMQACLGYSHTCYKLPATGRTWSSGWSAPGHPAAVLRRAGLCRCHTRFYPWQSSSRAARRSHCLSVAAMDRNILERITFKWKRKKGTPARFFYWVFIAYFTGYSGFCSAFQLCAFHSVASTPFKRLGH